MIGLILFGFGFVLGMLHGQGKLIPWVRGAAGKARELALGVAPARTPRQASLAPTPTPNEAMGDLMGDPAEKPIEVSPTPPKNPINPLKVLGEVGKFLWHWRHFIVAGILALIVWRVLAPVVSFAACPLGPGILWCANKEKIDESADEAAREHETDVATEAVDLAGRTHNNIDHAERAAARGQQDIEDAIANLPPNVSEADFADLDRMYRDAYLGVYSLRADDADPGARRPEPVRRSRADAA